MLRSLFFHEGITRMKKIFFLLLMMLCFNHASAMSMILEESPAVIVTQFGDHPDAADAGVSLLNAGKLASEYVTARLVESGKFSVLDSSGMDGKFSDENIVGIIAPDTARKIGELFKVKYIVYGNVTGVSVSDTGTSSGTVIGNITIGTTKADIVLRIMNISTGDILMAAKGEGRSKTSYVKVNLDKVNTVAIGTKIVTQDSVHNAIQKAAFQAVDFPVEWFKPPPFRR